ncbi:MAG: GNA1162 family protein [Nitrospiria bacterium]
MQNSRSLSGLALLALLAACASTPRLVPFGPGITPPRTIAVMPFDNQTNSVPGVLYVRQVVHDNLGRRGYAALPLAQTDETLSDQLGVSLGGQIDETMIQRIGEALGVDAVLTGTLQKFGTALALYSEVEATVVMYETRTGRRLWDRHAYARQETALAQAHSNTVILTAALVGSVIQRGRGKPLQPVVRKAAYQLLHEMPNGAEPLQKGGYTD